MPQKPSPLPDFTRWPSFPFEGDMRVKKLADPVDVEPPRSGEDASDCVACNTPDDAYIWVSERWRVRGMDRPTGLPAVLILECRSHLDIGDLPNLLAAELGVMTVRLERAIRSLDGVARVHVNRWGDGSAHLHMWFLARPYGRLQLRGTFLSLWDDLLPVIPEEQWLENLAMVAAWLADFGGRAIAEPAHIHWQSPSTFSTGPTSDQGTPNPTESSRPTDLADFESDRSGPAIAPRGDPSGTNAATRDLSSYTARFATASTTPAMTTDATDTTADTESTVADGDTTAGSPSTAVPVATAEPHPPTDTVASAGSPTTAGKTTEPHPATVATAGSPTTADKTTEPNSATDAGTTAGPLTTAIPGTTTDRNSPTDTDTSGTTPVAADPGAAADINASAESPTAVEPGVTASPGIAVGHRSD